MATGSSRRMHERAKISMPGGVSGSVKYDQPYPLFMRRANGSRIWDVDGNEYIDYLMSYGALVLGHGNLHVKEAMQKVLESTGTTSFGVPSEPEVELAEKVLSLYRRHGKLRWTNSGLEATLLAVRLAMARTGRRKIAKFEGHYHGANPFLLVNYRPKETPKGRPERQADSGDVFGSILEDSVVLPFNDEEGVKEVIEREGEDLAAVVLEPFEDGYIPMEKRFADFLGRVTKKIGALLVYDEVKTGFRVRLGGASEYYSQTPDLVCLGKIIGGGLSSGAVVGDPDVMNLLDPGSKDPRKVFHSGTYNGNPLATAAGLATVSELMDGGHESLTETSLMLRKELSEALEAAGLDHVMYGEGGVVNYTLGERRVRSYGDLLETDLKLRREIDARCLENGIFLPKASRWSPSLAHTEADILQTGSKFSDSMRHRPLRALASENEGAT